MAFHEYASLLNSFLPEFYRRFKFLSALYFFTVFVVRFAVQTINSFVCFKGHLAYTPFLKLHTDFLVNSFHAVYWRKVSVEKGFVYFRGEHGVFTVVLWVWSVEVTRLNDF